ncbi:hypothetical protein [Sporosarcina sp. YIM B06819]|uniref:hypothetical protein n=1 Tax=Sporosarcina sp. YIM B06819 TaxID=3081769 RepID=UPI00298D41CD|nr:hypothetical protein [Sporosarcina sp. YIM B06819]
MINLLALCLVEFLLFAKPEQRQQIRKYFLLAFGLLTLNLALLFHYHFFDQQSLAGLRVTTVPYTILLIVMVIGAALQFSSGILLFMMERKRTRPFQ